MKIPSTNNLTELLFRVTFPRKIKRIFRTYERVKRQIRFINLTGQGMFWEKNKNL